MKNKFYPLLSTTDKEFIIDEIFCWTNCTSAPQLKDSIQTTDEQRVTSLFFFLLMFFFFFVL